MRGNFLYICLMKKFLLTLFIVLSASTMVLLCLMNYQCIRQKSNTLECLQEELDSLKSVNDSLTVRVRALEQECATSTKELEDELDEVVGFLSGLGY